MLLLCRCFFLISLPPPRSTLFPYTTLFRSEGGPLCRCHQSGHGRVAGQGGRRLGCRRGSSHRRGQGRIPRRQPSRRDRKSTRLNSSHLGISYAVFCLKKKKIKSTMYTAEKQ